MNPSIHLLALLALAPWGAAAAAAPRHAVHAGLPVEKLLAAGAASESALQSPGVDDPLLERFRNLLARYENAEENYRFDVAQAKKNGLTEESWPIPPEVAYYDEFLGLAEAGSPWAMSWLVENLGVRHRDPESLAEAGREWHEKLFRSDPNSPALLRPLSRIPRAWKALGGTFVVDELSSLFERSESPLVRGNVLWAQGKTLRLMCDEDPTSPLWQDSITLFEQLLDSYPESPLGQDVALDLYPSIQARFLVDVRAWVAEVDRLSLAGVEPADWPEPPGEAYVPRMESMARTELLQAARWVQAFWREYRKTREQKGLGPGLCDYALRIGAFQGGERGDWANALFDLLPPLTRAFTGRAFYDDWIKDVARQVAQRNFDPYLMEASFSSVGALAKDPVEKQAAAHAVAVALTRMNDPAALQRALDVLRRPEVAEGPDEGLHGQSVDLLKAVSRVVPGADLGWYHAKTAYVEPFSMADLRGKVVLLAFFGFFIDPCTEIMPELNEFATELEGRPFELVGMNTDGLVKRPFRQYSRRLGITWTCVSGFDMRTLHRTEWFVHHLPSFIVVDSSGKIAGRDLDLAGAKQLVLRLLEDEH